MLTEKIWSMAQIGAEWVLWVLVILSVISLSLIVERIIFLLKHRMDLDNAREQLKLSLKQSGPTGALRHFSPEDNAQAAMLCEALQAADGGSGAAEEAAASVREQQKMTLERGMIFLGTLGNNAPFIGLFGTVLGIINAFRDLASTQMSQASARIMANISEALVATAVGLLLAIPAVIAFNIFQRRVKKIIAEGDALIHVLLSHLRAEEAADPTFTVPVVLPGTQGRSSQNESR